MRRLCLLLVSVFAAVLACGDGSRSSPAPASGSAPSVASAAANDDAGTLPRFSVADAVRLFEAVAACKLEPHGLDHLCPEGKALHDAYSFETDPQMTRYETVMQAAGKVLGHASPSVRARAFDQIRAGKDQALIARTVAGERDPMALRAMLFVAGNTSPEVLDAVVSHVAHPDREVRLAAMRSAAGEYNAEHPGLFEAIARRITEDPDLEVRADACLRLGLLQDPRSVAVFDRMLVAATPAPLFDACGQGLVYTWLGDPEKEHPVEAAFARTLALLRSGPYRSGAPGTRTLEALSGVVRSHRTFEALPRWVDLAAAREALAVLAATPRADENARRLAAETIGYLQPSVADLRRYRARVRDRSAIAEEVVERLTDAEDLVGQPLE